MDGIFSNKSNREIGRNTLYVLGWVIGLFFSAYSFLFLSSSSVAAEFLKMLEPGNIVEKYVYPMILIMLLFYWDTIHASWQDSEKALSITIILMAVSVFFVGFLVCLMVKCAAWRLVGFCLAWTSLALLKGYAVFGIAKVGYGKEPDNGNF